MESLGVRALKRKMLKDLPSLSHELVGPEGRMAILGEEETSARIDIDRVLINASGSNLFDFPLQDVIECRERLVPGSSQR